MIKLSKLSKLTIIAVSTISTSVAVFIMLNIAKIILPEITKTEPILFALVFAAIVLNGIFVWNEKEVQLP